MKTYATEVKPEDGPQGCMIEGSVFVRKVAFGGGGLLPLVCFYIILH